MSMLRRIRIQRYKSIGDVTLELGSVNILCGESCAGKTNLLDALALLGAAASGRLDHLQGRGIRQWSEHACALRDVPQGPIELEAASDRICYRVKLDETSGLVYLAEVIEFDGSAVIAREQDRGWMVLGGRRQGLRTSPDVGIVPVLRGVESKGAAAAFLQALRELAITNPSDVVKDEFPEAGLWDLASAELAKLVPSVAAGAKVDQLLWRARPLLRDPSLRGEGWIDLDKVGQGAASMLGLFLLLLSTSAPPILAIDGPDPGLVPTVAAAFAARVGALTLAGERQLLWISNRTEALDALLSDHRARVFRAVRDQHGATAIENITAKTLP